jgi:drug/metabolite transporter (DMT)-like permease
MRRRVLIGVLRARLYAQRRTIYYSCAAALVAGLLQPTGLAAPVLLCSLLGIAMALAQSPGLHPHLDRCEQCAPLFGRELARAKAFVPCIAGALAAIVYAGAQALHDTPAAGITLLVALAALVAGTLVAISATVRRGAPRLLYVLLAAATSVVAYVLVAAAHSIPAEIAFCAIVAFVAVRQYGEALARYDPI